MATKELTVGNPLKLILLFMFPIFIGNIFQQFYNMVDALIVGRTIGIEALAAIGATIPYIFLIISFVFASTQGFTLVTAQKFGANDYAGVRKSFVVAFILSAIIGLILTVISTPFSYRLLESLNTPDNIINLAANYLVIMFGGIYATIFYNLSANTIRALGDSKTPLFFLIFSSILNIFLDLLFILKFNMGIKGAGYATIVSESISTILCMSFMFWKFPILHLRKDDFKLSKDFIYEHLRVGIPMGIQMSVLSLGVIALQFVLNSFGSNAVAGFTSAMVIEQFFAQTYLALGAAIAVYSAQNFGANKMSRIKTGAKIAMLLVVAITLVAVLLITLFGEDMLILFMKEFNAEVLKLGLLYLRIIAIFLIFLGILLVFRNILQGMGSVTAPLMSGIAELIGRAGCAFLFGYYFGFLGICFATPAAWIGASIVLYLGFKFNLKKNIKRIKNRA